MINDDRDGAMVISSSFLIAEGISSYIKRRASSNKAIEDDCIKENLNTKSIIECDYKEEVQHIKENTNIIDKLSKYSKEDCSIKIDYYDAYGMFKKQEKVSGNLEFAIDEVPQYFDIKNGVDFCLEGKNLVMYSYGNANKIFGDNKYKKTKINQTFPSEHIHNIPEKLYCVRHSIYRCNGFAN